MNFPKDILNDLKVNTKKTEIVQLNTAFKTSGNNNNASYIFDWSVLPDVPYNVYFAFVASDSNAYVAGTSVTASIYIDLGATSTTYSASSNFGAQTTSYIGSLRKIASSGANYYLYSDKYTNPPIYISGRPRNNTFTVRILSDTGGNFDISMLGSYILTLYFEPV